MRRTKDEAIGYLKYLCEYERLYFILKHDKTFEFMMEYIIDIGKNFINKDPNIICKNIRLTKSNLNTNIKLVKEFYKEYGLPDSISLLIKNETLHLHYIEDKDSIAGYQNIKKSKDGYVPNIDLNYSSNIVDSAILVHEISHSKNCTYDRKARITRETLTEVLSFLEESIFADYLAKNGYKEDANYIHLEEMKNLFYNMSNVCDVFYLLMTYYHFGNIEKESYSKIADPKFYDKEYSLLLDDKTWKPVRFEYALCQPLAIYLYNKYKDNLNVGKEINKLQNDITHMPIETFIKEIGILKYNDLKKIILAIKEETNINTKLVESYKEHTRRK